MCHAVQLGSESPEMVSQQHLLFMHLRPEVGSERRIGDRLQEENVQIGDVAIVPAYATHWQGIEQDIAEGMGNRLKDCPPCQEAHKGSV